MVLPASSLKSCFALQRCIFYVYKKYFRIELTRFACMNRTAKQEVNRAVDRIFHLEQEIRDEKKQMLILNTNGVVASSSRSYLINEYHSKRGVDLVIYVFENGGLVVYYTYISLTTFFPRCIPFQPF